jgi:hypothetical protein
MIFWLFCAFIWFTNIEKMLLQMTSGFLQLESTLVKIVFGYTRQRLSFLMFLKIRKLAFQI